MKIKMLAAALAALAMGSTAYAQRYYSQRYYYPAGGSYYYYPATGTYSYGTTIYSPEVVQTGAYYTAPTYGNIPYYGTTYETYGNSPYAGYAQSYTTGPYLNVTPGGVSLGVSPFINQYYGFSGSTWANPRRMSRGWR